MRVALVNGDGAVANIIELDDGTKIGSPPEPPVVLLPAVDDAPGGLIARLEQNTAAAASVDAYDAWRAEARNYYALPEGHTHIALRDAEWCNIGATYDGKEFKAPPAVEPPPRKLTLEEMVAEASSFDELKALSQAQV